MQPETPTYQTEAEAIAAWNRRPATEALVERDAIYTPDQQRAADYLAEITGIGGGPDPVGSLIAIHNAQRLKREALVEALTEFTDYYPMGINPYLDEACRKARAALAAHRSKTETVECICSKCGLRHGGVVSPSESPF